MITTTTRISPTRLLVLFPFKAQCDHKKVSFRFHGLQHLQQEEEGRNLGRRSRKSCRQCGISMMTISFLIMSRHFLVLRIIPLLILLRSRKQGVPFHVSTSGSGLGGRKRRWRERGSLL